MNILFLTRDLPFPLDEGFNLVSYRLIKALAKRGHNIILAALLEREEQRQYIPNLAKYCSRVEVATRDIFGYPHERLYQFLLRKLPRVAPYAPQYPLNRLSSALFQKYPFFVYEYASKELRRLLPRILAEEEIDVVHADHIAMAQYFDVLSDLPKTLVPLDAMSLMYERNYRVERKLWKRAYWYFQWRKTRAYEAEMAVRFDKCIVLSPVDRDMLISYNPAIDAAVANIGVDVDYYQPSGGAARDDRAVIFRGIMSFSPNWDAALFFYEEMWPIIKQEFPAAKYYIAGKAPVPQIQKLAEQDSQVIVTGYVDDLRPYMEKCAVSVCPMRRGSGVKIKVMESMAMELPVVSTTIGYAGLDVTPGENILVADTSAEFAQHVIALLRDKELRDRIAANARQLIRQKYSWDAVAAQFEELYREAIANNAGKRFKKSGFSDIDGDDTAARSMVLGVTPHRETKKTDFYQNPIPNQPFVVIVILNWNHGADTLECLESLYKQDYANYRVIVVDNGSTDGSPEMIARTYSQTEVLENEANLGFAAGNNVGIARAMRMGADYVLLLNDDVVVDPAALREMVKIAEKQPKIGLVGPKIYYYDEPDLLWYAGARRHPLRHLAQSVGLQEKDVGQYDTVRRVNYVYGCAMLIKREVIERIGTLDAHFFAYFEDVDFGYRAEKMGYISMYTPRAKIWHKVSLATKSTTFVQDYLRGRARILFYRKHFGLARQIIVLLYETIHWQRVVRRHLRRGNSENAYFYMLGAWDGFHNRDVRFRARIREALSI